MKSLYSGGVCVAAVVALNMAAFAQTTAIASQAPAANTAQAQQAAPDQGRARGDLRQTEGGRSRGFRSSNRRCDGR
jgi:hypothetical protein